MTAIKMKKKWNNATGIFDFKKAITAADGIRHTFTLQRGVEMHSDQWDHIIYHLIKDALLEPFSIIFAPNNRPYLQVYVPSKEEIRSMQDDNTGIKVNATKSPLNQNVFCIDPKGNVVWRIEPTSEYQDRFYQVYFKDENLGAGGSSNYEYVIDKNTGKVIRRRYSR